MLTLGLYCQCTAVQPQLEYEFMSFQYILCAMLGSPDHVGVRFSHQMKWFQK